MKAILIDPVAQTVEAVEHDASDYHNVYAVLSDKEHGLNVDTFTVVSVDDTNGIYIDDEGLLNDPKYFFKYEGYEQPLAGRGLMLGVDDRGNTIAPTMTPSEVRDKITFPKIGFKGFQNIPEGAEIDHPVFGKMAVIGHIPIFGEPNE